MRFPLRPGGGAGAGGVVADGMPAVAGRAGGHDAVDGGVDVRERGAFDGVVAVANQGCGFGDEANNGTGWQGSQKRVSSYEWLLHTFPLTPAMQ